MYKSIQVEDFDFSIFTHVSYSEVEKYKKRNNDKLVKIQDYLLDKNNQLSVNKISKNLFLDVKPDIFLSHSHADENDVIRLAILMEQELNLSVFIDSCIWGDAFKLLREIDKEYCFNGKNFDYLKRNFTTSNIFMILNSALQRVIYNCEAFIFLGTDNSIFINEAFGDEKYLSSPWIYSELQFASLVRRQPRRQIRMESRDSKTAGLNYDSDLEFVYPVPKTDAILDNLELYNWLSFSKPKDKLSHPLDDLYKIIIDR